MLCLRFPQSEGQLRNRRRSRRGWLFPCAAVGLLLAGCALPKQTSDSIAPHQLIDLEECNVEGTSGFRLLLPYYVIHTTISDRETLAQFAQLMESAHRAYQSLAPVVGQPSRPLECYVFATRAQWAAYTRAHTGEDATIYLRVNRGGYTVNDRFVAYWIGPGGTFSVAAHEGWHQYVARNLKGRLPPFLEEGLACLFEQVEWIDGSPHFDLSRNHPRLTALQSAVDSNSLYPLARLVQMHAGQVVGQRNSKIEAFYAQSWAFARFLNEAEDARFRPALHRMLLDAAHGSLYADSTIENSDGLLWDPASAKPMLEHYLAMPLDEVEIRFAAYVRQLLSRVE